MGFARTNPNAMKKRSAILLSIATLVCLLVTAGSWRHRHHIHAERVAAWNKVAREAFREALMVEVEKRGHIEVSAIEQYPESAKTLITPAPDFVTLEIEGCVKREFPIPRERYEHRLIEELNSMSLFSFLLEGYPLSLDTLNRNWDSLLLARKVAAQTYVRYTYTDFLEHDSVAYSRLPGKEQHADSLSSYYMGLRMEHEATGFIAYRAKPVSSGWWCSMVLLWGGMLLAAGCHKRLETWLQRTFVRHEVRVQEKIVEKEVVVEKQVLVERKVYVADVSASPVERYDLGDGVCFDATAQELRKGEEVVKLAPQVVLFLKQLLKAQGHCLTIEEIYLTMWKGDGSPEKLHSLISRLRKSLKGCSRLTVVYENGGTYRLCQTEETA